MNGRCREKAATGPRVKPSPTRSGSSLMIPAMKLAAFRAGKGLKERIRR